MAATRTQIHSHRYVSGWCEAARHHRCKGSYAGAACCWPATWEPVPEAVPTGNRRSDSASVR
jgi:hypothetical protein